VIIREEEIEMVLKFLKTIKGNIRIYLMKYGGKSGIKLLRDMMIEICAAKCVKQEMNMCCRMCDAGIEYVLQNV